MFPDPDNIVRTVEVFFQGHHSLRTLDNLYPLEITPVPDVVESNDTTPDVDSHDTTPDVVESSDTVTEVDIPQARPRRAAAKVAAEQRRALTNCKCGVSTGLTVYLHTQFLTGGRCGI